MFINTLGRAFKCTLNNSLFQCCFSTKISKNLEKVLCNSNFDLKYLTNPKNLQEIEDNIKHRKGIGNIKKLMELSEKLNKEQNSSRAEKLATELNKEASYIPNNSHPDLKLYGDHPRIIRNVPPVKHGFKPKEFLELSKELKLARTEGLASLSGHKSYYFLGDLAELENALIKYTLSQLVAKNFKVISVPDILPAEVIERCGMSTMGDRAQVYFLDECHGRDLCLSGTSEMALAGLFCDTVQDVTSLPILLAAVSRCFRSEGSNVAEERGIYRVHQFTKVEMFGICRPEQSGKVLEQFLQIQESNFKSLGLSYQVLDMPMCELGAPAFRKFDVEAWLPGRAMHGEISSCSDCTTYQARRLNIKFKDSCGSEVYVHTVNGTACAVPRMMIALLETHQQQNGNIRIPQVLQPYFKGRTEIVKQKMIPDLKAKTKNKKS